MAKIYNSPQNSKLSKLLMVMLLSFGLCCDLWGYTRLLIHWT